VERVNNHRTLTEAVRVRLSPELLDELREYAEREERTVGAVIRRAIRDLLEREGKESR
jgi:predicted transcriptional regulator